MVFSILLLRCRQLQRTTKMSKRKIFISCGELSAEQHAANLVRELLHQDPELEIYAFGSDKLAALGVILLENYRDYSFSGLTEVLSNLPRILKLKARLLKQIKTIKPDIIILVDYAAFNMKLAKACKHLKPKPYIVDFIAPQIWASRPWRIHKIKRSVDKVFCTLPFEEQLYQNHDIPVEYVGNPVVASLLAPSNKDDFELNQDEILIGLFPGSRKSEIKYMLPLMIEASRKLMKANPALKFRFLLSQAPSISQATLDKYGFSTQKHIEIFKGKSSNPNHKLLSASDILWLCSGTVTLEATLYSTPYFLAYKSTFINYLFYKVFKTIDMAGLANIIAGKYLVKEFLQYGANVDNFVNETENFLYDDTEKKSWQGKLSNYYYHVKTNLELLTNQLSQHDTFKIVAKEVLAHAPTESPTKS